MSRNEWQRLVAAYERSGMGQREFAERRDVRVGTLRSWIYRLRHEDDGPRLLPVRVAAASSWSVEIAMPSGIVVRIGAGASLDDVAFLARALG
jgi:transposase-like protein